MRNSLLVVALLLIQSPLWAGIFSWVDASGNIVYGDNPPEAVAAEPIVPSKLTILENFANRYEDSANSSRSVNARLVAKEAVKSPLAQKAVINAYSSLAIIAPKPNQLIRASDGDVSVAVSMSPNLKGGDTLVLFLNGQEHSRVKSRVINLNNLEILKVELFNILGQKIREWNQFEDLTSLKLKVNKLKSTVYFVKVKTQEGTITKKIIIE